MTWPIRLINFDPKLPLSVGDMFYSDMNVYGGRGYLICPQFFPRPEVLSQYYAEHNSFRNPLLLVLPAFKILSVDGMQYGPDGFLEDGWIVTGTPPLITMSPEVKISGYYWGTVADGIIGDCEYRKCLEVSE